MFSSQSRRFSLPALTLLVLTAGWRPSPIHGAQLFSNTGFESGTWSGTYDFVETNNATQLWSVPQLLPGWKTATNTDWVNDPIRAAEGGRFLWLDPSFGPTVCVSNTLAVASSGDSSLGLVSGGTYDISASYAFFDPGDPTGGDPMNSSFEVYALLGDNSFGLDPGSRIDLYFDSGEVSPWNNGGSGSGFTWYDANIQFTLGDVTGYDYMTFFFSAPVHSELQPSRGVAVDNITLAAVPEPSSLLLISALSAMCIRRRRTKLLHI